MTIRGCLADGAENGFHGLMYVDEGVYVARRENDKLITSVLRLMKYLFLLLGGLCSCGVLLRGLPEDEAFVTSDASCMVDVLDATISDDSLSYADAEAAVDVTCPLHSNGLGQMYESCDPIGSLTESTARLACRAYVANRASMSCVTNPPNCRGFDGTIVGSIKYVSDPFPMALWDFSGPAKGHVVKVVDDSGLLCPLAADPNWD